MADNQVPVEVFELTPAAENTKSGTPEPAAAVDDATASMTTEGGHITDEVSRATMPTYPLQLEVVPDLNRPLIEDAINPIIHHFFDAQPDAEVLIDVFNLNVRVNENPWVKWTLSEFQDQFRGLMPAREAGLVATNMPASSLPPVGRELMLIYSLNAAIYRRYIERCRADLAFGSRYTVAQKGGISAWKILKDFPAWIHIVSGFVRVMYTPKLTKEEQEAVERHDESKYISLPEECRHIHPTGMLMGVGDKMRSQMVLPKGAAYSIWFLLDTILMEGSS